MRFILLLCAAYHALQWRDSNERFELRNSDAYDYEYSYYDYDGSSEESSVEEECMLGFNQQENALTYPIASALRSVLLTSHILGQVSDKDVQVCVLLQIEKSQQTAVKEFLERIQMLYVVDHRNILQLAPCYQTLLIPTWNRADATYASFDAIARKVSMYHPQKIIVKSFFTILRTNVEQ